MLVAPEAKRRFGMTNSCSPSYFFEGLHQGSRFADAEAIQDINVQTAGTDGALSSKKRKFSDSLVETAPAGSLVVRPSHGQLVAVPPTEIVEMCIHR